MISVDLIWISAGRPTRGVSQRLEGFFVGVNHTPCGKALSGQAGSLLRKAQALDGEEGKSFDHQDNFLIGQCIHISDIQKFHT